MEKRWHVIILLCILGVLITILVVLLQSIWRYDSILDTKYYLIRQHEFLIHEIEQGNGDYDTQVKLIKNEQELKSKYNVTYDE